jgi:alkaline phosphatase
MTGPLIGRNVPIAATETSGSFVDKSASDYSHRAMKRRNQILALVCLLAFAAVGILYFQNWVVQKPFGIILFIGEGLTAQRVAAARLYSAGADAWITLDAFDSSARLRNYSADFAVPDSGAAASAFATGSKVKNGALSVDESGAPLKTLLEIAHGEGRATGIVTDGALTNPTIAAFYAHATNAKQPRELANALIDRATIDVALGGGAANFEKPKLEQAKIRLARSLPQLEEISDWQGPQVLGIFEDGDLPFTDELTARAEKPSLADMVRRAIELLQLNRRGYVLVVDAHLMASAAWQNQGERVLRETLELDRAIQTAREYAGANLTIVVTGDVAIGGMNVNGFPFRHDRGIAILGLNSSGQPWITWATGPNGGRIPGNTTQDGERTLKAVEPAAVAAPFALSTVEDVIASASGARTEKLRGTVENTQIFSILRDAL